MQLWNYTLISLVLKVTQIVLAYLTWVFVSPANESYEEKKNHWFRLLKLDLNVKLTMWNYIKVIQFFFATGKVSKIFTSVDW